MSHVISPASKRRWGTTLQSSGLWQMRRGALVISSCSCGVKHKQIDEAKIVKHRRGASLGIATWWQIGKLKQWQSTFSGLRLASGLGLESSDVVRGSEGPNASVVKKIHAIVKRQMEVWSQRGPQHLNYWALADAGLLTSGPHPQSQLRWKRKSVAPEWGACTSGHGQPLQSVCASVRGD